MTCTKKGVKRHGDYVEVVLSSTDGHHSTVSKACSALGQPLDSLKTAPTLVRVQVARFLTILSLTLMVRALIHGP